MNLQVVYKLFLGDSPNWYKSSILFFLILNPVLFFTLQAIDLNAGVIVGWILLLEFIYTLALALKCYPLQPGGLLAIQALVIGLAFPI